MKNIFYSILILAFSCFTIQAQTVIVLTPNADAAEGFHDNFGSANNNYGTADNEQAMWQPGASGGVNGSRTVMNFDLSSIPSGTIITSAKINLYGHGPFGTTGEASLIGSTGVNGCLLQRVTSAWNELTTTWNTQPTSTNQNEVTLNASSSFNQNYLNIDVTQLVQDMLDNPTQSFGFMMRLVDESLPARALDFCSREYSDSSKHPMLEITYGCSGSTQYVLTPDADAAEGFHDNFGSANNNYGTADNEQAMWQPGASGGVNGSRTVMNFDLSSIPSGTIITSAKINLYGHGPFGTTGEASLIGSTVVNGCLLQRVTSAWNELTTTWNMQPTSTNQNEVALNASSSFNQDYLNIDVTQLVQDMLDNPTQSFGFMMRLVDESLPARALDFCSREYSDSSKHPMLTITVCGSVESVNENKIQLNRIKIIPNPCTTCEITGATNAIDLMVTDIIGRNQHATFSKSSNGYYINLHEASNGIFLIRNIKTGEVVKFVKQ